MIEREPFATWLIVAAIVVLAMVAIIAALLEVTP